LTVYHPFGQEGGAGRLFVHTRSDPYALVAPITRIIRELAADQPVERAATLEDVRAEVLAPNRLNALVFGGFAGVALAIALVGVAGVLAFSVSGRTRELAIRLAVGSEPKRLLAAVLAEGTLIAAVGVVAGAVSGWALARIARSYIQEVQIPDLLPIAAAAALLLAAAGLAAALPAIRAARVDVMQALRSE
jgi:putative ABC transport system permease protein